MSKEADKSRYKVVNAYTVWDWTLERKICWCTTEGSKSQQFDMETAEYVAAALNYYDAIRPRDIGLPAAELRLGGYFRLVGGGSDVVFRVVRSAASQENYALDIKRNSITPLADDTRVVRVTGEG